MYLDNCSKPREFQGHRSDVKVTRPYFWILYHCEIGQKKFVSSTITHEPQHLAWWYFAWTMCLDNRTNPIQYQGQRSRSFFR